MEPGQDRLERRTLESLLGKGGRTRQKVEKSEGQKQTIKAFI
jgi:hypothetical protein